MTGILTSLDSTMVPAGTRSTWEYCLGLGLGGFLDGSLSTGFL